MNLKPKIFKNNMILMENKYAVEYRLTWNSFNKYNDIKKREEEINRITSTVSLISTCFKYILSYLKIGAIVPLSFHLTETILKITFWARKFFQIFVVVD
jgi:hypothetical protein